MILHLSARSLVVVCPDCGQRYDPAKAAKIARVRTRDGRAIKPGRVEAQDVSTAGHRNGRHHRAHVEVTRRALDGWALTTHLIASLANAHKIEGETVGIDGPTRLWFVRTPELESLSIELTAQRDVAERIVRAAQAVRVDHPWWRAYLHELGVSPDVIARGLTVGNDDRADVLFRRRVPQVGPTLRGLL